MSNHYLNINGVDYVNDQLINLCANKVSDSNTEPWEKEIFKFIFDWISDSDYIIVPTSGSTGEPKKISLKKEAMVASATSTLNALDISPGNYIWLCLPAKYIAGMMVIVRAFVGKLNLIYSEPSNKPLLENFDIVDLVSMVPSQVATLMESKGGITLLEGIGKIIIGGSGLTSNLENTLAGNTRINAWNSYGMTETISHIALRKIGGDKQLGDFTPLPGTNVSLNHNNQLIISSHKIGVMNLLTNDIATIYDDGSFTILGRKDDIIISGGLKINPFSIEKKIQEFIVNEIAIIGFPDKILGNKLVLFIEGKDLNITVNDIKNKVKGTLTKYQIPKEIISIERFPRTETGKVIRSELIKLKINN